MLLAERVMARKMALMGRILRRKTKERVLIHCVTSEVLILGFDIILSGT
jgi:hypothetical protein